MAENLKRNAQPKKPTTKTHVASGLEVVSNATNSIMISGAKNDFSCQPKGLIAHRNKKRGSKGNPIDPIKVSFSERENDIFLRYTNGEISKTTANKLLTKLAPEKKKNTKLKPKWQKHQSISSTAKKAIKKNDRTK